MNGRCVFSMGVNDSKSKLCPGADPVVELVIQPNHGDKMNALSRFGIVTSWCVYCTRPTCKLYSIHTHLVIDLHPTSGSSDKLKSRFLIRR